MVPLHIKHPTYHLVQMPEGYKDYVLQGEGKKGFYIGKENTT